MKEILQWFYVLGLTVSTIWCQQDPKTHVYCKDLNPQNSLDVDQIMGIWFGAEIIPHSGEDDIDLAPPDSCVVLHLADITHDIVTEHPRSRNYQYDQRGQQNNNNNNNRQAQQSHLRYIRLAWQEKSNDLDLQLRFNTTRRGFWMSTAPAASINFNSKSQFTGTVQVMKAVGNQLILTFCMIRPATNDLFSIVLSRKPMQLTEEDTHSVRSMLSHRGLPVSRYRKVCQSKATTMTTYKLSVVLLMAIGIFKFSY